MRNILFVIFFLISFFSVAQEKSDPLIITDFYAWKLSPNGKWLAGGSREVCDVYNLEDNIRENYYGAKYGTITNDGILSTSLNGKPALLINGEAIVPESLRGAKSGSIQCISATGNRICGNINYPEAGISGMFTCDINENGIVGPPRQLPRPNLDFFGCKPQFVNMLEISSDGSTITGFVQDWRGFYCYPIIFRENEQGEWYYSFPTESLFNPYNLPIPENPWIEEPVCPNFTDYMSPMAKEAYEESLSNYYDGLSAEIPDAKDFMTEEQWESYYQAAISYNEWYYGQQEAIKNYDRIYNQIIMSSVQFDLNEIAISPDGTFIGCSYFEYTDGREINGIMKINTLNNEHNKYETEVHELYTTQILSNGTILASQPMNVMPGAYIILPDTEEIIDIKDYFYNNHPDYLAWIKENLENTGTIYSNDNMTVFSGSVLPGDCAKVEEITGGYHAFTYVFYPSVASVECLQKSVESHYIVFSLQGFKILDTNNIEEINNLPKGIYIVNGRIVNLH